jgi:hypothetical protein
MEMIHVFRMGMIHVFRMGMIHVFRMGMIHVFRTMVIHVSLRAMSGICGLLNPELVRARRQNLSRTNPQRAVIASCSLPKPMFQILMRHLSAMDRHIGRLDRVCGAAKLKPRRWKQKWNQISRKMEIMTMIPQIRSHGLAPVCVILIILHTVNDDPDMREREIVQPECEGLSIPVKSEAQRGVERGLGFTAKTANHSKQVHWINGAPIANHNNIYAGGCRRGLGLAPESSHVGRERPAHRRGAAVVPLWSHYGPAVKASLGRAK